MTYDRGFTIFFAMLVASLALAIGLSIYDLTVRELDLSSTATQSQYAVYAADTGAECALYWDAEESPAINGIPSAFGTTSPPKGKWAASGVLCSTDASNASLDVTTLPPPPSDIALYPECSGNPGATWCIGAAGNGATTTFSLSFSPQPYCAVVQVVKYTNPSGVLFTTVNSRGYNTCAVGATRVERTLQVSY